MRLVFLSLLCIIFSPRCLSLQTKILQSHRAVLAKAPAHHSCFPGIHASQRNPHVQPLCTALVEPDYLITDSIDLDDRPALVEVLSGPTMILRMALVVIGMGVSLFNIMGNYNDAYLLLQQAAVALGVGTAVVDLVASSPPYSIFGDNAVSPNVRCGVIDDAVVHLYSAVYTASATWLALRSSPVCPSLLTNLDGLLGWIAATAFLFSLLAPLLTLIHHSFQTMERPLQTMVGLARQETPPTPLPALTETEVFRAKNMLAIGFVGCLFFPMAVKLALAGQDWWMQVAQLYPSQQMLESSTALFGVFATQASMVAHVVAKAGVAPYRILAPSFALVCVVLTIFPCVCALHWLSDDISFFAHYSM